MGHKTKISKGEISITNYRGRIRLRWGYNRERYQLCLPYTYLPENLHYATVKATEIRLDIMKGSFDTTLVKYKSHDTAPRLQERKLLLPMLVDKFTDWGSSIRNMDMSNSPDYVSTKNLLAKCVDIPIEQVAEILSKQKWVTSTYNKRLGYLYSFFDWLVYTKVIPYNYLAYVSKKKTRGKKKCPRRKPLTEQEIWRFLEAIEHNIYCPKKACYIHSHYYSFFYFIFTTGVRNAEAVGLRVKHVDLVDNQIEISESLVRSIKGSHHAARIRKGTKMNNIRHLPLGNELKLLLIPLLENKEPDDLVFLSHKGLSIDDRMLQRRVFNPVIKALGIEKRDLYAARHSFGTRAVQQGMHVMDVAYLMGHNNIETTMRNYIEVTKTAITLPLLRIKQQKE